MTNKETILKMIDKHIIDTNEELDFADRIEERFEDIKNFIEKNF